KPPAGVLGAGSFCTAVANLLAENGPVLLYARREDAVEAVNVARRHRDQDMHENVFATTDIELVCSHCALLFPSVPSDSFRSLMRDFDPFLQPDHLLIHCTKGFDLKDITDDQLLDPGFSLKPSQIFTMSEVI